MCAFIVGVNEMRSDLSNVRRIRTLLFPDQLESDRLNTLAVMQWAQLIAHDTARIVQQNSGQFWHTRRIIVPPQAPRHVQV